MLCVTNVELSSRLHGGWSVIPAGTFAISFEPFPDVLGFSVVFLRIFFSIQSCSFLYLGAMEGTQHSVKFSHKIHSGVNLG